MMVGTVVPDTKLRHFVGLVSVIRGMGAAILRRQGTRYVS